MNLEGYSLLSILTEIKNGSLSIEDVNDFYYKKSLQLNSSLNAYITLIKPDNEKTKEELKGIAVAIKDNISTKGIKTTCASKMLENYIPPYDATVVSKLKQHGGKVLGKTNMDEFAMGSSGENSAFGPTRNPLNTDYVTGGSSSGSAAAVAADMAPISLGSDTGGSVRAPASFTGIVGFKPSYGAVSRYGLIAYANSLEVIGILGRYTEDVKFLFKLIAGKDPLDSTSINVDLNDVSELKPKILVIKSFVELSNDEVKNEFYRSINKLEEEGFEIDFKESFNLTEYLLSAYYTIACAEASTNLSRYDGIRYGPKVETTGNWRDYVTKARSFFGPEVKARIMMGTFILSAGYYETYYLRALQLRKLIKQDFEKSIKGYDVLYIPTMPVLPWKIGEAIEDPKIAYASDVLTVLPNLTGSPAISLPVGKVRDFFVGGQLIGLKGEDMKVLKIAEMIEKTLQVKKSGRN